MIRFNLCLKKWVLIVLLGIFSGFSCLWAMNGFDENSISEGGELDSRFYQGFDPSICRGFCETRFIQLLIKQIEEFEDVEGDDILFEQFFNQLKGCRDCLSCEDMLWKLVLRMQALRILDITIKSFEEEERDRVFVQQVKDYKYAFVHGNLSSKELNGFDVLERAYMLRSIDDLIRKFRAQGKMDFVSKLKKYQMSLFTPKRDFSYWKRCWMNELRGFAKYIKGRMFDCCLKRRKRHAFSAYPVPAVVPTTLPACCVLPESVVPTELPACCVLSECSEKIEEKQ